MGIDTKKELANKKVQQLLDSYALTLGLHVLGIHVEFKEVPEYECKDDTTPTQKPKDF